MKADCVIRGGTLVDPGSGRSGPGNVAIRSGRIAAVGTNIGTDPSAPSIDATGMIVTPGLVDLHTHIFPGGTYWGIDPDRLAARSCTTTWVDAGSAGAFNFGAFRALVVERTELRVRAFLHISAVGLVADDCESARLELCDVGLARRTVERNGDVVVGIKVRIGTPTVGASGCEPLRRARHAAEAVCKPVMVHIAAAPPSISDVLNEMRAGDIVTHAFTGESMRLVDELKSSPAEVGRRAQDLGILLDVGHGAGSFSFDSAERLLAEGVRPDVISSDLHALSRHGPDLLDEHSGLTAFVRADHGDRLDLANCMSKFLHLGMSLEQVVRCVTETPAKVLGLYPEIGSLRRGSVADVALLRLESGKFPLVDSLGRIRQATQILRPVATILCGEQLVAEPRSAADERPLWVQHR